MSKFYPTLESMFDIYAGVNDISTLNSTSANVVKLSVAKVIPVMFFRINCWFKLLIHHPL